MNPLRTTTSLIFTTYETTLTQLIGLNEKAVALPEFEESKFTTIFYIKNAKKAEIRPNHLAVQLCNSQLVFPPMYNSTY